VQGHLIGSANNNADTESTGAAQRLQYALAVAGSINCIVRTLTVAYFLYAGDNITILGIESVGSTQLKSGFKAGIDHINSNDPGAACKLGSHNCAETYTAAAGNNDAGADLRLKVIKNSTGAGLNTAAQRSAKLKIDILRYLIEVVYVDNGMSRESALTKEVGNRLAVLAETSGAVVMAANKVQLAKSLAIIGLAGKAVVAATAAAVRKTYTVAGSIFSNIGANLNYYAAAFVAKNNGHGGRQTARLCTLIGVAYATSSNLYKDFVSLRCGKIELLNNIRSIGLVNYGSFNFHIKFPF